MAYPDDLIAQAKALVSADPRRPRQANLRRAVSAAYYALFHEVVARAIGSVLSAEDAAGAMGARLRRTVRHDAVLRAAKWFSGSPASMPPALRSMRFDAGFPDPAFDPTLMQVCTHFVKLQDERHFADYDLSEAVTRDDTNRLIADAESAVAALRTLQPKGDTLIFFFGCMLGDGLTKNAS